MPRALHRHSTALILFLIFVPLCFLYSTADAKSVITRSSEKSAEHMDMLFIAGIQSVVDLSFKPCKPVQECVKIVNPTRLTVQYAEEKKQLIFTPLKAGETTVSVRDENGDMKLILRAVVSDSNLARVAKEIKDLLRDIEGIQIRIVGNKIVADGELIIPSDLNRVLAVITDAAYKDLVLNLIQVSPLGEKILGKRMQDEINNQRITVRVVNGTFILEGTVDSQAEADRANQIALNLMPEKVLFKPAADNIEFKRNIKPYILNLIRVSRQKKASQTAKTVRLTVNFVELAKSYNRNFGFNWQPGMSNGGTFQFGPSTTGGLTSTSSGALAGTIDNLFPKLQSAQQAGYARVLQEVILLTQSQKSATMSRGDKVPVQVVDARTGATTFNAVDVKLGLKITPTVNPQTDEISMDVDFTFQQLNGRISTAPIVNETKYRGTVSVRSSESAALLNLVTNDVLTDFNKDAPGAASANPIFALVRSKSFSKKKSQFVIFVTPQTVENAAVGTEDIKKKYGIKRR